MKGAVVIYFFVRLFFFERDTHLRPRLIFKDEHFQKIKKADRVKTPSAC